jgi:hypothetical protein
VSGLSEAQIKVIEVEVSKIKLQPGEVLVISIPKDQYVEMTTRKDSLTLTHMYNTFQQLFPNNKILLKHDELELSVVDNNK